MSIPRGAIQAMLDAVPDAEVRSIVRDLRHAPTLSIVDSTAPSGTVWVDPIRTGPVPCADVVDSIVEKFEPSPRRPKADAYDPNGRLAWSRHWLRKSGDSDQQHRHFAEAAHRP